MRAARPVARGVSLQSMVFIFCSRINKFVMLICCFAGIGYIVQDFYCLVGIFPVSQSCCCLKLATDLNERESKLGHPSVSWC